MVLRVQPEAQQPPECGIPEGGGISLILQSAHTQAAPHCGRGRAERPLRSPEEGPSWTLVGLSTGKAPPLSERCSVHEALLLRQLPGCKTATLISLALIGEQVGFRGPVGQSTLRAERSDRRCRLQQRGWPLAKDRRAELRRRLGAVGDEPSKELPHPCRGVLLDCRGDLLPGRSDAQPDDLPSCVEDGFTGSGRLAAGEREELRHDNEGDLLAAPGDGLEGALEAAEGVERREPHRRKGGTVLQRGGDRGRLRGSRGKGNRAALPTRGKRVPRLEEGPRRRHRRRRLEQVRQRDLVAPAPDPEVHRLALPPPLGKGHARKELWPSEAADPQARLPRMGFLRIEFRQPPHEVRLLRVGVHGAEDREADGDALELRPGHRVGQPQVDRRRVGLEVDCVAGKDLHRVRGSREGDPRRSRGPRPRCPGGGRARRVWQEAAEGGAHLRGARDLAVLCPTESRAEPRHRGRRGGPAPGPCAGSRCTAGTLARPENGAPHELLELRRPGCGLPRSSGRLGERIALAVVEVGLPQEALARGRDDPGCLSSLGRRRRRLHADELALEPPAGVLHVGPEHAG
mmetsp:Transcript_19667/g.46946  ORF Transcript_19667/g.46946 Transcript_19667/m.46946 type:complete len:573 (-) Transcript_19667:553-2271(-)